MALFFSPIPFLLPSPQDPSGPTPILHSHSYTPLLPQSSTNPNSPLHKKTPTPRLSAASTPFSTETKITDFDSVVDELDPDEEDLAASPWEGAVVYRRDASVTHVEYATTLERLGLAKVASELSRVRASAMGIRLPVRMVKDCDLSNETPVLISIDVTRRKRRLKLDGILRTVITLRCNRCAEPATENIFSNFTLLLTEDPVEDEHDETAKSAAAAGINTYEMEDDEKLIDQDDKLHFSAEEKEIDISKHIRDLVHIEITINAVCDAKCKGLCLQCGANLNKKSCDCCQKVEEVTEHGAFRNLRQQMQQR